MDRDSKFFTVGLVVVSIVFLLAACASSSSMMKPGGTWGAGAFISNGEHIDFISIRKRDMASNEWMIKSGQSACMSCHGSNEHSNIHTMGMMTAKDIRLSALQSEFAAEKFHTTLAKGQAPEGTQLNADIPRWNIGNADTANLFALLTKQADSFIQNHK